MIARVFSGVFALFVLVQTAHAEDVNPWIFTGKMPKDARVIQLTSAQITPQGLAIATQNDGYVVWSDKPLDGPVDVITIRAHADQTTKASLLWQPVGGKNTDLLQLYFDIQGGDGMHDNDVIVSQQSQWSWKTDQFALALPAGSSVLIEEMQFRHWPFYERLLERWKSFWTFDSFRPYSINFLWGPLLSANTPSRDQLFATLPPSAPSVTRYFYAVLILAGIGALIAGRKQLRRDTAFGWFLAIFVFIWMLFDVRMGAEIMSYAVHDVQTYVMPDAPNKVLRNFIDVYAHRDAMLPFLTDQQKVAILAPAHEVYEPLMRYAIYPRTLLTDPATTSGATAWAIFDRNDLWVDDTGHLRQGNDPVTSKVLTGTGHIAEKSNDNTFLFLVP